MSSEPTEASTDSLLWLGVQATDASTMAELAAVVTRAAGPLVDAANSTIGVVTEDRSALRIYRGPAATEGHASMRLLAIADDAPMTDAVRTGRPVLIRSADDLRARYPGTQRRARQDEFGAIASFPLELAGVAIGACGFRFADGVTLSDERVRVMEQMLPFVLRGVARIKDRDALVAYADQLEHSNRDLDNFAAVVAHDLSAPVRRIGSFFQLLEREIGPLSGSAERYADIIRAQVRHLDALLRDTLAYAQAAAPSVSMEATPLREVIDQVVKVRLTRIEELDASITIADLPVVEVEPTLVRQVFANLIDNSLKYRDHQRPPHIEISAQSVGTVDDEGRTWWRISVRDNGIGIDPAHYEEVFAMFARLEVSADRPGTGVGLPLIKRVVERHGGEIGLAPGDAHGVGTIVWFTLPGPSEPDVL